MVFYGRYKAGFRAVNNGTILLALTEKEFKDFGITSTIQILCLTTAISQLKDIQLREEELALELDNTQVSDKAYFNQERDYEARCLANPQFRVAGSTQKWDKWDSVDVFSFMKFNEAMQEFQDFLRPVAKAKLSGKEFFELRTKMVYT